MQQTIRIGRVQPSILSRLESFVKNCKSVIVGWFGTKSNFFSSLCGESVSNGTVVAAHAVVIVLLFVAGIAGALEGGAL